MFSVVAKTSGTFFGFPCSADEQVCKIWERAEPEASPGWPMEIFHTIDVVLTV